MNKSINFHDLDFFEICTFVFFVEFAQQLVFISHLFRDLGQKMENKVFQWFLRPVDDELLVS